MVFKKRMLIGIGFLSIITAPYVGGMEQEAKVPTYLTGWKPLRACDDKLDMTTLKCYHKKLMVNLDEEDVVLYEPFSKLWHTLDSNNFPFLLLVIQDAQGYCVVAPAIGETYKDATVSILPSVAIDWQTPITRKKIQSADIYFGGPDGNLYMLRSQADQQFMLDTLCSESSTGNIYLALGLQYETNPTFPSPNMLRGYDYVAQLFTHEYDTRESCIQSTCHNEEDYKVVQETQAAFKKVVDIWNSWKSKDKREISREEANLRTQKAQEPQKPELPAQPSKHAISLELENCLQQLKHALQQLAKALM